jgi:hypothetical protein
MLNLTWRDFFENIIITHGYFHIITSLFVIWCTPTCIHVIYSLVLQYQLSQMHSISRVIEPYSLESIA